MSIRRVLALFMLLLPVAGYGGSGTMEDQISGNMEVFLGRRPEEPRSD